VPDVNITNVSVFGSLKPSRKDKIWTESNIETLRVEKGFPLHIGDVVQGGKELRGTSLSIGIKILSLWIG
jgi:hypothetical protein